MAQRNAQDSRRTNVAFTKARFTVASFAIVLALMLIPLPAAAWYQNNHNEISEKAALVAKGHTKEFLGRDLSGSRTLQLKSFTCLDQTNPVHHTIVGNNPTEVIKNGGNIPDQIDPFITDTLKDTVTTTAKKVWKWLQGQRGGCTTTIVDSQQWRHSWFVDSTGLIHLGWGNAPERSELYYKKARDAFLANPPNNVQGFFYLALAIHYVQDMAVPWHVGYEVKSSLALGALEDFFKYKCDHSFICSGHNRYERDMGDHHRWGDATNLDTTGMTVPRYAEPGDYARNLAHLSRHFGPFLTGGYVGVDAGQSGSIAEEAGIATLKATSQLMLWEATRHSAGLIEHLFRELPSLQAGKPQVAGNVAQFTMQNVGPFDARDVLVRLVQRGCNGFWLCNRATDVLAETRVTIPTGQTITVSIPLAAPVPAWARLGVAVDPTPLDGSACGMGTQGCLLESGEALGQEGATPEIIEAPLPDLAIEEEDLTVLGAARQAVVTVHNEGEGETAPFEVRLYSRDPATGTLSLAGTATMEDVEPGGSSTIIINYNGNLADPVVRLDEAAQVAEVDDVGNNQAAITTWTIQEDFEPPANSPAFRPGGDVIVTNGARLKLTSTDLHLAPEASLIVEPGSELVLQGSVLQAAEANKPFQMTVEGDLTLVDATVSGIAGGLVFNGDLAIVKTSTLHSQAGSPALTIESGEALLERNQFVNGQGPALLVGSEASVLSDRDTFAGNLGTAIDVRGGYLAIEDSTIRGSPVGLQMSGGATVDANNVVLQPSIGLNAPASTIAVRNNGGVLTATNPTISDANVALQGTVGRITLEGGSVSGAQLLDASGSLVVVAHTTTLTGSRSTVGASSITADWPVEIDALGPSPYDIELYGARFKMFNAQGAEAWNGTSDESGFASTVLPQFRQTAAGTINYTPYRLQSQYNAEGLNTTVDLTQSRFLTVRPTVLPDLILLSVTPVIEDGESRLEAAIANAEPAPAPNPIIRFFLDGEHLENASLSFVPPENIIHVSIPRPAVTGIHTVQALADAAAAIPETFEDNNALQRQVWVVAGTESCTGTPAALNGTLQLLPGSLLTLNDCDLALGGSHDVASLVDISPGATLRLAGGTEFTETYPDVAYQVKAAGRLEVVDSTLSGMALVRAEDGSVLFDGATITAPRGTLLEAFGSSVDIRDSLLEGGGLATGLQIVGGSTELRNNVFEDFLGNAVVLENQAGGVFRGNRFATSDVGYLLVNASILVEDEIIEPTVKQSLVVFGSNPILLNVTHDFSTLWLDAASRVTTKWHTYASVRGVDDEAVPGTTVTVINRFGQWLGQFDTSGTGMTSDMRLTEFTAIDVDGDGRAVLPTELSRHEPYTLESGLEAVSFPVLGNALALLPQTYDPELTTNFKFLQGPAGATLQFPVTARNLGNGNDTTQFAIADVTAGWAATVSPTSAVVGPGGTASLTVRLTAPNDNEEIGFVNVTATSEDGEANFRLRLMGKTAPNLLPTAAFNPIPGAAYTGEPVSFQDLSTDPDGWIDQCNWDFGDGQTATGCAPSHVYATVGDFTVRLTAIDNAGATAVAQRVVEILNRRPILEDGIVTPTVARTGQPVTFQVNYRDLDGHAPAHVRVYVDGVAHDMAPQGSGSPVAGQAYAWTTTTLARGNHVFRFEAGDNFGGNTLAPSGFTATGPLIADAPSLLSPSVTPASGTPQTMFTYRVTYVDPDDDAPAYMRVTLDDGTELPMVKETLGSQSYATGVAYVAHTTIEATGGHTHTFSTSDGAFVTTSPAQAGPDVTGTARLSDPSASPPMAAPGQTFTFQVAYRSADGVAPNAVRAWVDGQARAMSAVAGTPEGPDGQLFEVQVVLNGAGAHPYFFEADQGAETVRLPTVGQFSGPVTNTPPTPALVLATTGTIATVFAADARASTDAETPANQLESRIDWGDGETTGWSKTRQHTHQYRATGTYEVRLDVRDAHGLVGSLTRTIQVINVAPTAAFVVTPGVGNAAEGAGPATVFTFQPGASGDVEDGWDDLAVRWDWDGDGAWDTAVSSLNGHFTHVYPFAGTFQPRLEVRDTAGQTATASQTVVVDGLHKLEVGVPSANTLTQQGQTRVYPLDVPVPDTLDEPFNAEATLGFPEGGSNLDLYAQRGAIPDLDACEPPACKSATRPDTQGPERICWRFPEPGTYYLVVVAESHPANAVAPYDLVYRTNVVDTRLDVARCMALG